MKFLSSQIGAIFVERRVLTALRWLGLGLLLLATALATAGAAWQIWYTGRIFPGVAAVGIPLSGHTPSDALALLQERSLRTATEPVLVTHRESIWILPQDHELSVPALGQLVNEAYALGRSGHPVRDLAMRWRLLSKGYNIVPGLEREAANLDHLVDEVIYTVSQAPRDTTAVHAEPLQRQIGPIVIRETSLSAALSDSGQETHSFPSNLPLQEPLVVTHAGLNLQFAVDARSLAVATVDASAHLYDPAALQSQVQSWAGLIDKEPQNPRLHFNAFANALEIVQPSELGVRLNVEDTVAGILTALQAGETMATLHLEWLSPEFTREDLPSLGIHALVGHSETYFKGSSAARVHNIELTTKQFASVLIAPGEVFSFNETIGPITVAAGYADAAIIWGDRTAIGVGGGVCQVSTTIFRSALHAGLPIEERYNHGYVVSWYGQPGLDATIYTPLVDLKFRNDTSAHLLLQPDLDVEKGTLAINLFGTPTDRVVDITDPVISRVTDPEPPIFVEDKSLAPGKTQLLEEEKLGLTVVIDRNITENGITRFESFVSVYRPWRAVYAEGPALEPDVAGNLELDPGS